MEKNVVTGDRPWVDATLRQEAVLRFMVDAVKNWSTIEEAARFANECADAYIESLNAS